MDSYHYAPRRASSSRRPRDASPTRSDSKALVSALGGAAVATLVDKYLIQDRRHSHDEHRHSPLRRLADIAVGGYAGYEAYDHYHARSSRSRRHSHSQRDPDPLLSREDERYIPHRRARSHSRGSHHATHLLEAAVGAHGLDRELQARRTGHDDHAIRHGLETAVGAYGAGKELVGRRR